MAAVVVMWVPMKIAQYSGVTHMATPMLGDGMKVPEQTAVHRTC